MRKSKLANICLYTSLGVILLNILAVIIMFTKTPSNFIKVMSRLYSPVMILSVVIFIASIISLVRILISKGQLKGLAKSIAALVLSVVMFIGAFAQGLLAEAVISTNRAVDSTVSEVGQETPSNSLPKFVKKDFDIVAVAKYSDKNSPGNYIAGFIDKSGDFVIEPKFRDAKDFYEGLAPVKAKENGKWGYIDKTDNFTIQPSFDEPTRFVEGLAILKSQDTGKIGYMDTTGNFVVEPQFGYASRYFSGGLSLVLKDANDFTTAGFVDKEGKFMNTPIYSLNYNGFFSEGLFPICKKGEEYYGYIDKTGEFVIEPKFLSCDIFSEGLAAAVPQGEGKYGYIDKTGNYVIEPKFYGADSFLEGLALVYEKNKGEGFIDKTGEYVIGPTIHAKFGKFRKIDGIFDPKKANLNELKID